MVILSDSNNSYYLLKVFEPQPVITEVVAGGGSPITVTPAAFTTATTFCLLARVKDGALSIAALSTLTYLSGRDT